jgi:crotonobetainyl-CoA:carnitine CoA-transferase CaiB-like acyl-CoA transferase
LADILAVEVGHVLAGPYAGAILADLGADVKVERHDGSDDARHTGRLINKDALFAEMAPILSARPRAEWIGVLDKAGMLATQNPQHRRGTGTAAGPRARHSGAGAG